MGVCIVSVVSIVSIKILTKLVHRQTCLCIKILIRYSWVTIGKIDDSLFREAIFFEYVLHDMVVCMGVCPQGWRKCLGKIKRSFGNAAGFWR